MGQTQPIKRLTLELRMDQYEKVQELMGLCEATSITETIRRAINVTRFIVETRKAGGKIFLQQSDGSKRELLFDM